MTHRKNNLINQGFLPFSTFPDASMMKECITSTWNIKT